MSGERRRRQSVRFVAVARAVARTSAAALLLAGGATLYSQVTITRNDADHRINVTMDDKPFTSLVWPDSLTKPVLFPLIAPDGTTVTRGFPLEPRSGERIDHPHHAGVWFNYGNVNGFDFWNNSGAIPEAQRPKMGSTGKLRIVSTRSGAQEGEIVTESTWTDGTGTNQLTEHTRYVFRVKNGMRLIDRIATLTALKPVVFHDDKEGLLGIRVAHFLESPTEKGGMYNDASGRPTKVDTADTAGATGVYRTASGISGDKVWGTRSAWCGLSGTSPDGKAETIAILDNPANPGYPTYWHARGYGLFAANPLGNHIFDPQQPERNFTLQQGKSATFRYRILITSSTPTPAQLDAAAADFAKVK